MLARVLATLVSLAFLIISVTAQAAPLFPLQLGGYYSYDGSDAAGHTWNCKLKVVAANISLNGQNYFHIRQKNGDPFDPNKADPKDFLMRCTDTQTYMSMGGGEAMQFQIGPTSTSPWPTPDGDTASIIADNLSVTVPFGTFNPVYKDQFISSEPGSQPWYAYLFPNLGMIKQEDYWVDTGRAPAILALREIGTKSGAMWPLKNGMLMIYNASDSLGNHWQMTKQVVGQIDIQGQTFFKVKTSNFDPINGENGGIDYLRSTEQQVFGAWDGSSANVWYQAAGPNTTWSYPGEFPGSSTQTTITGVTPVQVMGGSYLAYVHELKAVNNGYTGNPWFLYMVPGLGLAYEDNYRIDGTGTRLYFTLARISQGGAGPAVSLLLMD